MAHSAGDSCDCRPDCSSAAEQASRAPSLVAVLFVGGGGEGAALALLPATPVRKVAHRSALAEPRLSVTAAPTRFQPRLAVAGPTRPRRGGRAYYGETASRHVPALTEGSFMALYREAERAFGVSWRLVASIHRQETAFSTEPSTYHGLNAFGCCAGPMQFNVTNGPVSTWDLYRDSFRQGKRPRHYPHRTRSHPSVYDDFDAIMAAAALLRDAGAGAALDGGSWSAAYDYYGHDLFGIDYADQVLGRAQGWELYGFCLNCPPDAGLVAALDDAYGREARRELLEAEQLKRQAKAKKRRDARARRHAAEKAREDRSSPSARDDAPPAPKLPPPVDPEPLPAPQTTTTPDPVTTPDPPAQPAAPPPPPPKQCNKVERLLGCGG